MIREAIFAFMQTSQIWVTVERIWAFMSCLVSPEIQGGSIGLKLPLLKRIFYRYLSGWHNYSISDMSIDNIRQLGGNFSSNPLLLAKSSAAVLVEKAK
jgi:hypothetical protein